MGVGERIVMSGTDPYSKSLLNRPSLGTRDQDCA